MGEGGGGLEVVSLLQTKSSCQGRWLHHPGVCYKGAPVLLHGPGLSPSFIHSANIYCHSPCAVVVPGPRDE